MGARKQRGKKKATNLYFSNRKAYYTKKRHDSRKQRRTRRRNIQQREEVQIERTSIYRYSIAYFNATYGRTFRAEVLTSSRLDRRRVQDQLQGYLDRKVDGLNKGLRKMYRQASFVGLEEEEVGQNDITARSQLNKMYFTIS